MLPGSPRVTTGIRRLWRVVSSRVESGFRKRLGGVPWHDRNDREFGIASAAGSGAGTTAPCTDLPRPSTSGSATTTPLISRATAREIATASA